MAAERRADDAAQSPHDAEYGGCRGQVGALETLAEKDQRQGVKRRYDAAKEKNVDHVPNRDGDYERHDDQPDDDEQDAEDHQK